MTVPVQVFGISKATLNRLSAVLVDLFAFGTFPVFTNPFFVALPHMPLDYALVGLSFGTLSEPGAHGTMRLGRRIFFIALPVGSAVG
ncbi:hypothetical protein D3C79_1014160 [compost metagenome]